MRLRLGLGPLLHIERARPQCQIRGILGSPAEGDGSVSTPALSEENDAEREAGPGVAGGEGQSALELGGGGLKSAGLHFDDRQIKMRDRIPRVAGDESLEIGARGGDVVIA